MTRARPRVDLEGVALVGERDPHMPLAIFRHRTEQGLVLLIPESADVKVPWGAVEAARLDLKSGELELELAASYAAEQNWLRGARTLRGKWMDRFVMR